MQRKIRRNIDRKREHAILSASGAHRWLKCTPSALLEEKYPDTQSESASEGTFAHALGELKLREQLCQISETQYMDKIAEMQKDPFWSNALVEYVDEYVDYVLEQYNEALTHDDEAALLLEQSLDFSEYVPQGFGRGDAVIMSDGTMQIIDLKYGRNVAVRAEGNPQLRLYALGAIAELSCIYDIDSVVTSIVQPRNGGISAEFLTLQDLQAWGESIKPIAQKAIKGEGEIVPGAHCRFCKAAPRCRAMREQVESVAKVTKPSAEMTDDEIAEVLEKAEGIISWLHKVQDYALKEARDNGQKWPGFKLVEGRSNRKYSDEEAIANVLSAEGYNEGQIYKPSSLIGMTDMQNLLGKKNFDELLGEYIVKPPGKPTLVPQSDKRPEWNSPDSDFEDLG